MLPATLVTFATFLLELCAASPVYNMQPAFITANIGTAGRNIRNLPCISRKTNQSGVCMFAIDCLKANGTHLGTCIDRFYFGSCCRTEPVNDIIENTIDIDIIPPREPPQRLSSTIRPIPTTSTKTETTPTKKTTPATKISTEKPKPVKQEETTTVSYKLTTFQSVDGSIPPETTTKPSTTPKPKPTTPKPTSKPKPTKTTTKPTKATPKPTRATTTTKKPVSTTQKLVVSTKKPSTTTTTRKPSSTTRRPTTTAVRRPSTSATSKPSTSATRKPSTSATRKPSTSATRKPSTSATRKPSTSAAHKPSTTATRKPSTSGTRKPSTGTTRKPSTIVTKKPSIVTTRKPVTTPRPTTKVPTTPSVKITAATTTKPTSTTTTTVKPSTVLDRNSTEGSVTGGNLASNEIETASSTVKPSSTTSGTIVTWTISDRNVSVATTSSPSNSTSEEWVPITTPDNWVPLPSVQPSPTQGTSSSSAPPSSAATIESSSKPSITYIPLESTTSSSQTTNASTAEGVVTSASTPVTGAPPSTTTDSEIRPVNMSDFTDVCGRRMYPEGRIVGGEKASFGKWPWQISLRQWRTSTYLHKCGAALLNENWAITAAHCVDNVPPSDLLLRLGEHDLSTESEPYLHQERRVQIVASHPQFDPRTFEYDLALLRFYEPVTFQPNILPVCVPQTDENFVGRTAYVTGWGRLYEDGPLPSILQEVSVPVINNSVCESMYRSAGYIEHIPHIFICAGWRRGGFDSCEGDSGGPMVIQRDDKRFLLAGVISWGIGCAEPNQPGVYTRISEFRDWINQILQF